MFFRKMLTGIAVFSALVPPLFNIDISSPDWAVKLDYRGKSTERNPDGSYRGETTLVRIDSLEVFGET